MEDGFYEKAKAQKVNKDNGIKDSVTLEETVKFLNQILKIDKEAINSLFSMRIGCNEDLADHETVQVGRLGKDYFQVGMIGIFNGLFGKDEHGRGHISADYEKGKIIRFRVLTDEEIESFQK